MSTQDGFGALLDELARETDAAGRAHRHHLARRHGLDQPRPLGQPARPVRAREHGRHVQERAHPVHVNWEISPKGQHIELGIAEMNLFLLLAALGLSHSHLRRAAAADRHAVRSVHRARPRCAELRLLPGRALHRWSATPSGLTLAPEGGAHQSIGTPLIGMAQDGLAAFEPAFVDELAAILAFALDYMQKDGDGEASERNWLRDETGGSVYLRLSTRPVEQIKRAMTPELRQAIVDGAYWLREPGPNCQVVVAYTGAVAPEAIQAVGLMAEDRRDVGLLAVTSADRLNAGWTAALRARERGLVHARSHIERLLGGTAREHRPRDRAGRPSGDIGLARRGARPSNTAARRGALRPDRLDSRPLPALRHRRQRHRRRRPGHRAGPPDPAPPRARMTDKPSRSIPVAIVGGGPVGLMLALFLDHYGVRSVRLQQRARGAPPSQGLDAQLAHHGASPAARYRAASPRSLPADQPADRCQLLHQPDRLGARPHPHAVGGRQAARGRQLRRHRPDAGAAAARQPDVCRGVPARARPHAPEHHRPLRLAGRPP